MPTTTTPRGCCFGVRIVVRVMVVVVVLVLVSIAIIIIALERRIIRHREVPNVSEGKVWCCCTHNRARWVHTTRKNKSTQKRNPNFDTLHWFRVFNDETSSSFPRFRFTHHHYITFLCRCCSGWSFAKSPRFCSTRRRLLTTTTGFFGSLSLFSLFERPERERERERERRDNRNWNPSSS